MKESVVRIDLAERSYDVRIASGLLRDAGGALAAWTGAAQAVVVSDTTVAPLHAQAVLASLAEAGPAARLLTFPAGEPNKTLATVSAVLDDLLAHDPPIDRKTVILALGGGVVGDLAGFVAAVALRGLRFLQLPTTLLAAVDSSVGGKTGVDHAAGKNLIGAFHQPAGVLCDVETLRTLPKSELCNGLAECVKHAVIRDAGLLDFLESRAADLLSGEDGDLKFDAGGMIELIARNVAIKAKVVGEDERESGVRAHLNFGHTIGHAVETFVGYETMSHGQAVALGMVAENALAVARGLLSEDVARRVRDALAALGLPTRQGGLDAKEIWRLMQYDKKAQAGRVRIALPRALGDVAVYDDLNAEEVNHAVESLR
ncbi:MAG: 3-dehydroquinate synthase [Phycisphaerae bacterium]|nr:3-dehydroquinate synthase [Phycisphaerae bacterium]